MTWALAGWAKYGTVATGAKDAARGGDDLLGIEDAGNSPIRVEAHSISGQLVVVSPLTSIF